MDDPDQRGNDDCEPHAGVHPAMKLTLPGLKELFLPSRANRSSAQNAASRARALFQAPDNALTPRPSPVQFLAQVSLFEDLFFFNDTATTEIYTLSLHDALPI